MFGGSLTSELCHTQNMILYIRMYKNSVIFLACLGGLLGKAPVLDTFILSFAMNLEKESLQIKFYKNITRVM